MIGNIYSLFTRKEYEKPYQDFLAFNGHSDQKVHTEYWWTEDYVADKLTKEKFFGNSEILKTREHHSKPDVLEWNPITEIVKGPFSPIDLWVPGKAFIEVRYTSDGGRDHWGYDFNTRNISRISNFMSGHDRSPFPPAPARKQYRLYLALIHCDAFSLVDLTERHERLFSKNQYRSITINVNEERCVKRYDKLYKEFEEFERKDDAK